MIADIDIVQPDVIESLKRTIQSEKIATKCIILASDQGKNAVPRHSRT